MDELMATFIQEGREQLQAMEAGLLRLEQAPHDGDNLNAIFRAAHTIKGGSGVIECRFIEGFTHHVENTLDRVRHGDIPVDGELASLMLACCDHMGLLLDVLAAGGAEPDALLRGRGDALLAELGAKYFAEGGLPVEHADAVEVSGGGVVSTDAWHVSIRFGRDMLRRGMDPLAFVRYLASLGEVVSLLTVDDALPAAAEMDPESCYLGFEVRLQTRLGKSEIERVFDFCRDECTLCILPPHSKVGEYLALIEALPERNMRLGEMLVRCGALTQAELDAGLLRQQAPASGAAPIGAILIEQKVVQKELVDAAASRQAAIAEKKTVESRMLRVRADKLDQLIDLVGELVIAGAGANLAASLSGQAAMVETTSVLSRLVEDIRDAALQLRMVQIGETFNRFQRVVRDTARAIGKEIELVTSGGETELDKSVIEKIGDPLMHLVRNAIDHGIETADLRRERNKPAQGCVRLEARHESGGIVIEVADDGGGLDRDKLLRKAIERGLVAAEQNLSNAEIDNLIFEPGFSTADQVTNISGRGVGMDVVKKNIEALRGSIELDSKFGVGTTIRIRLPLTLAIIDGFLVGVGDASFVVPLDMVVECLELPDFERRAGSGRNYLNLRGEVLPFVRLRELFALDGAAGRRENVVVVSYAGRQTGLVVDRLLGEFQTVIKPLGQVFRHLRGISGSTILGSGEVALILDVPATVQHAERQESRPTGEHRSIPQAALSLSSAVH